MEIQCILFYQTPRKDDTLESTLDHETAGGRMKLLGVSAPERGAVPPERQNLPFYPPEALKDLDFDYVVATENSSAARHDQTRSCIKRLLPPALMRLYYKIMARLFSRKKLRQWQNYTGWGKTIERQPDRRFPERCSPVDGIPAEKIIPARALRIPGFRMDAYVSLRERGITFLSDNCWGGLMYHTLGMEMHSPFINMFVNTNDFVKLINDLPRYLSLPLVPEKLCVRRGGAVAYPIVMLGDIRLHFNHVTSPEELADYAEKWYRRRERMDLNTLYVESCFVTTKEQEQYESGFSSCPYPALLFTPYPSDKYVQLPAFNENAPRYKGDFSECTRDCAKNDYPGEMPFDILQTFLTRTVQSRKEMV